MIATIHIERITFKCKGLREMELNRPGNQLHGKAFEDLVQKAHGCSVQHFNGLFDLPAMYDDLRMQVQIKTVLAGRDRIDCADASRWWRNLEPIHLFVGNYRHDELTKVFFRVDEYILGVSALRKLKGQVPAWEVERVHAEVRTYPRGEHFEARNYAHSSLGVLETVYGISPMILNPKIDSKSQRRIQCSLRLRDLAEFKVGEYVIEFRGIRLPFTMESDVQKY